MLPSPLGLVLLVVAASIHVTNAKPTIAYNQLVEATSFEDTVLPTNASDLHVGIGGSLLSTDNNDTNPATKPTTATGQTVMIVDSDAQPLVPDETGIDLHPDTGHTVPTNIGDQYNDSDESKVYLPYDEAGKAVYPIIGTDGKLMPTDLTGARVDANCNLIRTDDFGRPIDAKGSHLPYDDLGRYLYPEPSTGAGGNSITTSAESVGVICLTRKPSPTDASDNFTVKLNTTNVSDEPGVYFSYDDDYPFKSESDRFTYCSSGGLLWMAGRPECNDFWPTETSVNDVQDFDLNS